MAPQKKLKTIAEATGRTLMNPARYEGREDEELEGDPLGPPDEDLHPDIVEMWKDRAPHFWWLKENHRIVFTIYCRLAVKIRQDLILVEEYGPFFRALKEIGGSPASEHKFAGAKRPNKYLNW